jgi:hypothetical protein
MVGLAGVISMERNEGGKISKTTSPPQLKNANESNRISRQFAVFLVWLIRNRYKYCNREC